MKKTKSAVKYGMETLKLTPDELFKLIESSQGYEGSDYKRWLASKIIDIAEKDGVLFSQLLVKKFNIINEILEEVSGEQEIRKEFLEIFKNCLNEDLYSVDIEGIGHPLDVDWYTGLDIDIENSFFVKEKLPLEIQKKFLENEKVSVLFRVSLDGSDKKSDLYADAKAQGMNLTSKGSMLLYRLCNMASALDISDARFGLLVPAKFLYDEDNRGIIDYLLSFYKIEKGFVIKSIELSLNSMNAGDLAFITLRSRTMEDEMQDGVLLTSITLNGDIDKGYSELGVRRYSQSSGTMLDKIRNESVELEDKVVGLVNGSVSNEYCLGYKDALGYLNIGGGMSLSSLPVVGKENIAITKENILDVIAYYGVTVARELPWGYSDDIPCFMDGVVDYEELLYNCLPLFLFDYNSDFRSHGSIEAENKLDVMKSPVVARLLGVGSPYFSFEAKELFNLCRDYVKYCEENMDVTDKSFRELREMSDNEDLNNLYSQKLVSLKEFVYSLSKKYM